jgi:DNA-binding NtrC family response regulator
MLELNIKKIFIVDDDIFWVTMLSQMLSDIGYANIETFSNGTDCISNLNLKPDLIFLDYQMDDIDGLEVLKEIKNKNTKIGVVFCTALEDISVAVDALKYGSIDYLLKSNASKKEISYLMKEIEKKQTLE